MQPALPSPFPFRCWRAGAGPVRGRGRGGVEVPGIPCSGMGAPSTAPGPLRIPGTGGTGWGMGLCRKMPPPLPLLSLAPSPRFPSASAWEIWALQSHTRAKEILLELILLNLNFKVRVVGRRRTVGNTSLICPYRPDEWYGEKKPHPLFVWCRPAKAGVSPRENELFASYSHNPNPKFGNRGRWFRKISNVGALTLACPAPKGIGFHSGATQMVPQTGPTPSTLPPPSPSGRCWLLNTCRVFFL